MRSQQEEHREWYEMATDLAALAGVCPRQPRVCTSMTHRANAPAPTIYEHYRINLYTPFLDHIIVELDTQFTGEVQFT